MLHRTILLLFTILGLIPQAAGENRSVFECRHVFDSELIRALRPFVATESGATISSEDGKVLVTGGSNRLHEGLRELESVVDIPKISVATRFLRLHHVDVTLAAAMVSKAFTRDGDEELPLQAVPSVRTRQVFVMAKPEDMKTAKALLLELDRFYAATSRGCGGGSIPCGAGIN